MDKPKWTVLFNYYSSDGWCSRVREFFSTEEAAQERYEELHASKQVPTKRPYYHSSDKEFVLRHITQE